MMMGRANRLLSLLVVALLQALIVSLIIVPVQQAMSVREMQSSAMMLTNNTNGIVDNGSSINSSRQANGSNRTSSLLDEDRRFRRRLKSASLPEFSAPIGNVTAVLGRDTRLICTVEHLGQYQGFYQCQVNTSPMRSTSGYLEVVVPPKIVESQTSQLAGVAEHSNVSMQCRANGHPRPSISWRREDGAPIKLNGHLNLSDQVLIQKAVSVPQQMSPVIGGSHMNDIKSDRLSFHNVDRSMGGVYICSASNGIPTQAIKRIPLYVEFAPKTSVPNKYVSISLGDQLEVVCLIEAYPKANSYWSKTSPPPTQAFGLDTDRLSQQSSDDASDSRALSHKQKPTDLEQEAETKRMNLSSSALLLDKFSSDTLAKLGHQSAFDRAYSEHLHNRIQLRQVDRHLASDELAANFLHRTQTVITNSHGPDTRLSTSESKAYITVKQTTINPYTIKLKMTIARMQADDYGQYYCISTNSLGTAESLVIVTRADKLGRNFSLNVNSSEYPNDGLNLKPPNQHQQASVRQTQTGNRAVYDTNYLKAIKTRQNNIVSSSKLQQKLKLRQYSDRNAGSGLEPTAFILIFMLILSDHFVMNHQRATFRT